MDTSVDCRLSSSLDRRSLRLADLCARQGESCDKAVPLLQLLLASVLHLMSARILGRVVRPPTSERSHFGQRLSDPHPTVPCEAYPLGSGTVIHLTTSVSNLQNPCIHSKQETATVRRHCQGSAATVHFLDCSSVRLLFLSASFHFVHVLVTSFIQSQFLSLFFCLFSFQRAPKQQQRK